MLAILVGLTLGMLILLAMPFDVAFRLDKDASPRLRISLAWAFGLLSKDLDKSSAKLKTETALTPKPRRKPPRTGQKNVKAAMAFIRSPGVPARLLKLARAMGRQLRVRRLSLHLTFGLEDPADTGQLFGALVPALMLTQRMSRYDLQIHPDFSQPILVANGRGQLRVIPLTILGVIFAFLLSPTLWKALVAAAKAK